MSLTLTPIDVPRGNQHRFEVTCEGHGRYIIDVSLPQGYEKGGRQLPVVLVVDGNLHFDRLQVELHGSMSAVGSLIPPSIVVGVGYPQDEGFASFYSRRNFDFHGSWDMSDDLGKTLQEVFAGLKKGEGITEMEMRAGGYDSFMRFLRDDLLPSLGSRFPIDPLARHTLIGHSSGGHFTVRALYDPRSPFRRYVALSPSLGTANDEIARAESAFADGRSDYDVDVYVGAGTVEVDAEKMFAMCRFGSGTTWVAEQFAIRRWPNARLHWEIMNNEDHASILARGIAAGLRSVHGVRPGVHTAQVRAATDASRAALTDPQAAS